MTRRVLFLAIAVLACTPSLAWAHGAVESTDPEENAVVARPPQKVSLTLTEAPTEDAVVRVVDGCETQVVDAVAVNGETVTASLSDSQPGHFRVQWHAISAVDGHPTEGKFAFHVRGRADCSKHDGNGGGGTNGGGNGNSGAPGDDSAAPPSQTSDESDSFPIIPIALGIVAIVGLALVARRAGAR